MAKHSKGKHTKPKAGPSFPFTRKDKKSDIQMDEAIKDSSEEAGGSARADESKGDATDAHGSHTQKADAKDERPADDAEGSNSPDSAVAKSSAEVTQVSSTDETVAFEPVDTSASDSEEPSDKNGDEAPAFGSFMSSSDILAAKKAKRKKIAKRIGITSLSVIGTAAAVYLVGVFVFSTRFMPNTHIDTLDLSFETPEAVQADFDSKVGDYKVKVKGNGLNIAFTSEDAGLKIDSAGMTKAIMAAQDPWKWPIEVFQNRDMTTAMTDSLTASKLAEVVSAAVDEVNATAKDPVNAYIAYDPKMKAFDIVPEVQGTKLDAEEVLADILLGAMNLQDEVVILDDDLIKPEVNRDDKKLVAALSSANEIVDSNISLNLGGTEAYIVTADDIQNWVSITPEFNAVLDDAAMMAWSEELASQFNTVGASRTYTRHDGKNITVSGGDYGWKVDQSALAMAIAEAIRNGISGSIDVPVLQSGTGYSSVGGKDWGNRYIDVDISEQHARFYDESGVIIWESDIVSGALSGGRATPYGVYDVNLKGRNVTLTGRDGNGDITYESHVTYWMPFVKNSIGFHDATWQSAFGGNRYRSGHGSHGCINLPYSKAEELYGLIQVNDVVVVHG